MAIQTEALRATRAVEAASAERLHEADGEGGFPVLASMLCFEAPSGGRRPG